MSCRAIKTSNAVGMFCKRTFFSRFFQGNILYIMYSTLSRLVFKPLQIIRFDYLFVLNEYAIKPYKTPSHGGITGSIPVRAVNRKPFVQATFRGRTLCTVVFILLFSRNFSRFCIFTFFNLLQIKDFG